MLSAFFTFIILVVRMAIDEFAIKKKAWSDDYIKYIISYLIQAITVILLFSISISCLSPHKLAISSQKR